MPHIHHQYITWSPTTMVPWLREHPLTKRKVKGWATHIKPMDSRTVWNRPVPKSPWSHSLSLLLIEGGMSHPYLKYTSPPKTFVYVGFIPPAVPPPPLGFFESSSSSMIPWSLALMLIFLVLMLQKFHAPRLHTSMVHSLKLFVANASTPCSMVHSLHASQINFHGPWLQGSLLSRQRHHTLHGVYEFPISIAHLHGF